MFFNPFPHAIGLDIGDLTIKMVQLDNISRRKNHPSFRLVNARSTQLPHGLIVNGELEKPEAVRKYLLHLLEKRGDRKDKYYKSPWVVASIPDRYGFIKLIQLEKEPEDIIDEDIIIASQKHVPFQENDYYLDWQIVPSHNHGTEYTNVLLASIPKNIANMYTYLLESVGLIVVALELGALSTVRTMITANKHYDSEGRGILRLGSTESTLTVYDHDHVQFSKSLNYSGEVLTAAIAQNLHITYEEAEMKKKAYGLEYTKNKVWPILAEQTDKLIVEIEQILDFYYTHFPFTNKITKIVMCGGGSTLKNLDKALTAKLKIETKTGDVWKNLSPSKPINMDTEKSLRFAKAIGLALRAAGNPFFDNNYI